MIVDSLWHICSHILTLSQHHHLQGLFGARTYDCLAFEVSQRCWLACPGILESQKNRLHGFPAWSPTLTLCLLMETCSAVGGNTDEDGAPRILSQ